jgi:hypothetical protein
MTSKQAGITLEEGGLCATLQFDEFYSLDTKLRSGSYGTVYITKHKESGEEYAVKVIDRGCVLVYNLIVECHNIFLTNLMVLSNIHYRYGFLHLANLKRIRTIVRSFVRLKF